MPNATIKLFTGREYGPGEWAEVATLPDCQACSVNIKPAQFDARSSDGRWGYFCLVHFLTLECSLGTGFGQRLVLPGRYKIIE